MRKEFSARSGALLGRSGESLLGRDYWLPGMHPSGLIRHARDLQSPPSRLGADELVRVQRR